MASSIRSFFSKVVLRSGLRLGGAFLTTSTLSSDQNDFTVTGIENASVVGLVANAAIRITGLVFGGGNIDGDSVLLLNNSQVPITLMHSNTGSAAANRFSLPGSQRLVLYPGDSVQVRYVSGSNIWMTMWVNKLNDAYVEMFDDFDAGSNETGEAGRLGWSFANGTFAPASASATPLNGEFLRTTAATANNVASATLSSSSNPLFKSDLFELAFRIALSQTNADFTVRFGIANSSTPNPPTGGVYFERLSTDTSWFGVCRDVATQTRTAAIISQDTLYHNFQIQRLNSTNMRFIIDHGAPVDVSTNVIADATNVTPFLQIIPTTNTARSLRIDSFKQSLNTIVSRAF